MMKTMKKRLAGLLVLAMMLQLTACGAGGPTKPGESVQGSGDATQDPATPEVQTQYAFTIGTSATASSIIGQTAQYFAKLVGEKSGGAITVQCYTDAQLGSDSELVEGVQMGTITMVIGSTAPQTSFVPALALFDIPQVYDSIETAYAVVPIFKSELANSFSDTQLHLGSLFATVFRWMSCNKELDSMDDFRGVKIRTMENPYHMGYWNSLGCTATPLAFSELYMGLQQGVVDAQENPLDIFMSSNFYEVQDYVILTKHIAFTASILMNESAYASLPAEHQAIMDECFALAEEYAQSYALQVETENLEKIEAQSIQLVELDDGVYAQMKQSAAGVETAIRGAVGDVLVDTYLDAIAAAAR